MVILFCDVVCYMVLEIETTHSATTHGQTHKVTN